MVGSLQWYHRLPRLNLFVSRKIFSRLLYHYISVRVDSDRWVTLQLLIYHAVALDVCASLERLFSAVAVCVQKSILRLHPGDFLTEDFALLSNNNLRPLQTFVTWILQVSNKQLQDQKLRLDPYDEDIFTRTRWAYPNNSPTLLRSR